MDDVSHHNPLLLTHYRITITGRNETVLWSAVGNYTYITTAYIWKDSMGEYSVVGDINPGQAIIATGTIAPDPTTPPVEPELPSDSPVGPITPDPTTPPVEPESPSDSPVALCTLCPVGSSATPAKRFVYGGDVFTCSDMEDSFLTFSSEGCALHSEGGEHEGFTYYYRALCECPGWEPSCPLCGGEQVADLDAVVDPDYYPDITCLNDDRYFMTLPESECSGFSSEFFDETERICGCPSDSGQMTCPFENAMAPDPEDNRIITVTVYTDRYEMTCNEDMWCDSSWKIFQEDAFGSSYTLPAGQIEEIDHGCPSYEAVRLEGDQVCIAYFVSWNTDIVLTEQPL